MTNKLEITLTKSVIGSKPVQRKTIQALGLRKINQAVQHNDTVVTRGMINKVAHLVAVKEL